MAKAQCKEMSIKITSAATRLLTARGELNFLHAKQSSSAYHSEETSLRRATNTEAGPHIENTKTENA